MQYDDKGTESDKTVYKYDSSGNMIEDTWYSRLVFKYDKSGKLIDVLNNGKDNLMSKFTYKYDKEGNQTEMTKYDSGNKLKSIQTFHYDSLGNKIRTDKLFSTLINKFDSAENLIETIRYNISGDIRNKVKREYDSDRNLLITATYNTNNNLTEKTNYKYDSFGKMIEQIDYDANGKIMSKKNYKYDNSGNLLEIATSDVRVDDNTYLSMHLLSDSDESGESILIHIYKFSDFDSNNNWLRNENFRNDKLTTIVEREIEYY